VNELHRVLEGDDVVVAGLVEEVDQGGEGGGLARARGTADQDQSLVVGGDLGQVRRQADLGDGGWLFRDDPEDGVVSPLVEEDVAAVSTRPGDVVAQVELGVALQPLLLLLGEDLAQQLLGMLGGERLAANGHQVGGEANHGGLRHGEVEVRCTLVAGCDEQAVETGLALGAGFDLERRCPQALRFCDLGVVSTCHLLGDLQGPAAHETVRVRGGHPLQHLEDLRVLEVAQRQNDLDADLAGRVLEQLGEGGQGPGIGDTTQGLHSRPAGLGVFQGGDQGLHRPWILEPAENVGGGNPDPPVRILEKGYYGGDDSGVVKRADHHQRRRSYIGIRVCEELEGGLDEVGTELLHGFQRAIPGPAGQALGEVEVAADQLGAIVHAEQDLQHRRTGACVAGGHQRQDPVRQLGSLALGHVGQGSDEVLLGRVGDPRQLGDDQVDALLGGLLCEDHQRTLPEGGLVVSCELLPTR